MPGRYLTEGFMLFTEEKGPGRYSTFSTFSRSFISIALESSDTLRTLSGTICGFSSSSSSGLSLGAGVEIEGEVFTLPDGAADLALSDEGGSGQFFSLSEDVDGSL